MAILDVFRRKGVLCGQVTINDLPSHETYSVTIALFRVTSADSLPPFDGDPPVDKYIDVAPVREAEEPEDASLRFRLQRPIGFYYVAVTVIAYLRREEKMYAQVERFFPLTRPCHIVANTENDVELSANWPNIPIEDLHVYGKVRPNAGKASNA